MLTKQKSGKNSWFSPDRNHATGFTLIELIIVVALISIILTVALPVYSNYKIRAKVSEALSLATKAKTVTSDICRVDPTIPTLTNTLTGFEFEGSIYIDSIEIGGPCLAPIITIQTANTGAATDPVLTLMGHRLESGNYSWACVSSVQIFAPTACRDE